MTKQNKDLKQKAKLWFNKIVNRPYQGLNRDCTIEVYELGDKELYNYLLDNDYIQSTQKKQLNMHTGEVSTVTTYKRRWCILEYLLLFSLIGLLLGMFIPMGWALCTL